MGKTAFSTGAKASSDSVQQKVVEHQKVLVGTIVNVATNIFQGGQQRSPALRRLGHCSCYYFLPHCDGMYCSPGVHGTSEDQL